MMLKYMELKICSKICRMSVRLAVQLHCSVSYDETRTDAKNDPNFATNGILSC
ncbi:hypothetical protein Hanom_Chr00s208944g01840001 [Helianthus anomalus]